MPNIWFALLLLFLPTQLGRHFWPDFAVVSGIRVDYLSPTIYLTDIFLFLSIAKWTFLRLQIKQGKVTLFLLATLVADIIIGIAFSQNPLAGMYGFLKLYEFCLLGLFISQKINLKEQWGNIILLLAVGVCFESVLAIMQFVHQSSIGGLFWFFGERGFNGNTPGIANSSLHGELVLRPYATFPHPNVLAGYLTITMAIIITHFKLEVSYYKKMLCGFAIGLGTIALVLTMSRVAILLWFMIGTMFFVVWFWQKYKYSRLQKLLVLVLLIGSISCIFVYSPFWNRISSLSFVDESVVRREELITSSLLMLKDHPLVGVGLNNFIPNLLAYQKTTSLVLLLQPVHNIYLLVFDQIGIVGGLLFLLFLYKTLQKIHQGANGIRLGLLSAFTFILLLGLFDHYFLTLQQGQLLLTLVIGLSWALHNNLAGRAKDSM